MGGARARRRGAGAPRDRSARPHAAGERPAGGGRRAGGGDGAAGSRRRRRGSRRLRGRAAGAGRGGVARWSPPSPPATTIARWAPRPLAAGATAVAHGEIARHPATTRAERKAAARLLYRIIHKTQDNAITRYLYRPVSFPLTRLLVHTPVTPNQVSYAVAVLVAIGCWLTARGPMSSAIAGTALCLFASYVDCCDGEIARLKLLSSRFGAWLDTVIDELSQIAYMVALGWHCRAYFGVDYLGDLGFDPWLWAIAIGAVTYVVTIYIVYFNIIVVVGSANSQDYVGRFEVVDGAEPGTVRLRPAATQAIATRDELHPALKWLATYLPYVVRKDFISWGALILAFAHLTQVAFAMLVLGGPVTAIIVGVDHLKLRGQLRAIARRGCRLTRSA
ncbi:MAG: CDP-alcohol phosphatidyltransferase family protein [Kofleriaceae bacterium]|nr:CDP-alcohol phosphatidyltransferase family protein [Kofleriaceae bacterium]